VVQHYCDFCGDKITKHNACCGGAMHCRDSRLGIEVERDGVVLKVEIMTSLDGVSNKGDVCRFCVLDALNKLDTRNEPKKPRPIKV
jgi:hypothetical protein